MILLICSSSSPVNDSPLMVMRLSFNCFTEDAPIMTEVTLSSVRIHARAICANVCPRLTAISFN